MKDKSCPFCRNESDQVAIVRSPDSNANRALIPLKKFGIKCETEEIKTRLDNKLNYPCPVCHETQDTRKNFKTHMSEKHPHEFVCNVCAHHEFVFTDELEIYTKKGLQEHIKADHATCPFCDWHFYSAEELNKHCKTQHESCFICERFDPTKPRYFPNYSKLRDHFQHEHYMCMVPSCLEDKFIVFGTRLELQKHMLEEHRELVNVKEMQRVNMDELAKNKERKAPKQEDEKLLAQRRYTERLKIDAHGDGGRIDQILQANQTFVKKYVPAPVFIQTYTSVLKDAPAEEVTALLEEFNKFTILEDSKKNMLEQALLARRPAPTPEPQPGSSQTHKQAPARAGPSIPFGSWANRAGQSRSSNRIDTASLPRLGQGHSTNQSTFGAANGPKMSYKTVKKAAPQLPPADNLPTLSWGGGPQTRMPGLSAPGFSRGLNFVNPSPHPSSSNSRSASPSSSVASSAMSSRSSSAVNLRTDNLPSLPSKPKRKGQGKRVLKIV